ncbi:MAG TPA: L-aspartate oxidase [Bryobacteraceae bacterium]|nr:L-aspartate oxidase [Bryobacteraceae bacterium]
MVIAALPEHIHPDFLVIGAGVAGLRAAIELAPAGRVLVVTKSSLHESSSEYAQGGIAAALADDDDVSLHEQDTLRAGDGLSNVAAVRVLVEEGPARVEELIEWGAEFDREGSKLLFAREGAHSRSRVLHAHGDSTGQEIARTLYRKAASLANIRFLSFGAMTDLLLDSQGGAAGATVLQESSRELIGIRARAVLLATGGLGRVFRDTTNPDVATGDGVAAAYRAGAEISDLEFVQFHPTALHVAGAPPFLLSEALRGEGAVLRNQSGEQFMERYHPMEELASRDIVSRAIVSEIERTGGGPIFLDLTQFGRERLRARFPRIYETCLHYGIDLASQPGPVHPAAHYAMGGVRTDLDGGTNLERLYAAGEAACTGVHGANRLASNSLLEGLVYGARAGRAMREARPVVSQPAGSQAAMRPAMPEAELRALAWQQCGIIRTGEGLASALERLAQQAPVEPCCSVADYELRNMHAVARLIAACALARRESRGAHYRLDYPEKADVFAKHSIILRDQAARFE